MNTDATTKNSPIAELLFVPRESVLWRPDSGIEEFSYIPTSKSTFLTGIFSGQETALELRQMDVNSGSTPDAAPNLLRGRKGQSDRPEYGFLLLDTVCQGTCEKMNGLAVWSFSCVFQGSQDNGFSEIETKLNTLKTESLSGCQ